MHSPSHTAPSATRPLGSPSRCPQCEKTPSLCLCDWLEQMLEKGGPRLPTRIQVLILQHPQEPKEPLSTAKLSNLCIPNSTLKIGLSWPNLKKALGVSDNGVEIRPSDWAVLYLGSGIKGELSPRQKEAPLLFATGKGTPLDSPPKIRGLIVLDGTWSQAKALWWRNPWLLKLNRILLNPKQVSLYRHLRKEPRKECLSSIEALALTLSELGEDPKMSQNLIAAFQELLSRIKLKKNS